MLKAFGLFVYLSYVKRTNMSTFIKDLMAVNPDAAYTKRDRWLVIAKAYVEANPGLSFREIREGLGLGEASAAASSCRNALLRLVTFGKIDRYDGMPCKYWPIKIVHSNVNVCGTLPQNWSTVLPYTHF